MNLACRNHRVALISWTEQLQTARVCVFSVDPIPDGSRGAQSFPGHKPFLMASI